MSDSRLFELNESRLRSKIPKNPYSCRVDFMRAFKAMSTPSKLQVLRGFRPFARSLTVYNSDNFDHTNDRRAFRWNILRAIGCTVPYSASVVVLLSCWLFFALASDWNERIFYLVIFLSLLQQLFIALAMIKRNRQITDALGQLQTTIDAR